MIEEIQKSIQLINFNDSIFDQKRGEFDGGENDAEIDMLKAHEKGKQEFVKFVQFEELLKSVIRQEMGDSRMMGRVLVAFRPLLNIENADFLQLIEREEKIQAEIEDHCFGRAFCRAKVQELKDYERTIFTNSVIIRDFPVVLMKKITSPFSTIKVKSIAASFTLIEAKTFAQLNFEDFYHSNNSNNNNNNNKFVELFNKFTNVLISEILSAENESERKKMAKKVLKLAKEFAGRGAMNCLKSCMAAFESSSVHRLELIKGQGAKYQKRFEMLSSLTSAESNFMELRRAPRLVPWLGILLRDFAFIRETHKQRVESVNVPLGFCLVKLLDSMAEAREACLNHVDKMSEEEIKRAAIVEIWLSTCEIKYWDEETQYLRSKEIIK